MRSTSAPSATITCISARQRITQLLDEGTFEEWYRRSRTGRSAGIHRQAPIAEQLVAEQNRTGLQDAAVVGAGIIRARPVAFAVTDFAFITGSMGSVVGEKLTRAAEGATQRNCR